MEFICRTGVRPIASIRGSDQLFVQRNMPAACGGIVADRGTLTMLDVIYILIGAAFLGGCILYAIACDHL